MANALLSPKVYANTALALLTNQLVAAKMIDGQFSDTFQKKGDTIYVKRPPEFTLRTGPVVSIQDVVEGEQAVKIDRQIGVDFQFTSVEETLTVDSLMKSRSMKAATAQIAQGVDSVILGQYVNFPNWVGTPGQIIDSTQDFSLGPKRLDNLGVPMDGRFALMGPNDHYGLVGNFVGLNTQEGVANQALKEARLPRVQGVDPYMTQGMPTHTTGTRTNGTIAGAAQQTTYVAAKATYTQTLNLAGLGAGGTVKAGDVFSIAGV
ncbi:MAG TPA: P22 phage major capsid protein family protein, partial [Brevundimonas sp.]